MTTKELLAKLEKHEAECTLRYKGINARIQEGSDRIKRLEGWVIAIYPFFITLFIAVRFFD
jgi:hypothetical protein|tara:strand:+ start:416 stop:598 length:183 start_codon:yes stop_codon:yes gene_type:complete